MQIYENWPNTSDALMKKHCAVSMQETAQWLPDSSKRFLNCLNKKILCLHECDFYLNFTGGGGVSFIYSVF